MISRRSAVVILAPLTAFSQAGVAQNSSELEPAHLEAQYVSPIGQFVEVGGMRLRGRIHRREGDPEEVLAAISSLLTLNARISARWQNADWEADQLW